MSSDPHHAVRTIRERAAAVMAVPDDGATGGFWRRWFAKPPARTLADEVRAFVSGLDYLLDVPPTMITRQELVEVGLLAEQVVRRIEAAIDETAELAAGLAPAIYVIRTRYEELYHRGASKTS